MKENSSKGAVMRKHQDNHNNSGPDNNNTSNSNSEPIEGACKRANLDTGENSKQAGKKQGCGSGVAKASGGEKAERARASREAGQEKKDWKKQAKEKDEQRKKKARAERERRERAADAEYAAGRAELRRRARWAEQVELILGRETGQEAAERKFEEASARRRADWW